MATLKQKIQSLISKANTTTGKNDTNLTDAVNNLAAGYGQGGEDVPEWDATAPDAYEITKGGNE